MSFFYGASSMSTFLSPYQIGGTAAPAGATDDFDDGTIDASFWTLRQTRDTSDVVDTTISVAETGGQLVMTSGGDSAAGAEAGYISETIDFTGQQASVELAQHDLTFGLNSFLMLQLDLANRVKFGPDNNGNLQVQERIGGAAYVSRKTVTYNNTTHRFLRIRSAGTAIVYEFSADGATWTIFYLGNNPFVLTAVKIFLLQNTGIGGVTAGKFTKFDNFILDASTGGNAVTPANASGGTFSNGVFTKTGPTGAWDAGFSSVESITGDGSIEWFITEADKHRAIGLATSDPDLTFASIPYAIYESDATTADVYESAVLAQAMGAIVVNTTHFKIERVGTTLTYYKNGVSQRAVPGITTAPLFADISVLSNGGTIGPIIMKQ